MQLSYRISWSLKVRERHVMPITYPALLTGHRWTRSSSDSTVKDAACRNTTRCAPTLAANETPPRLMHSPPPLPSFCPPVTHVCLSRTYVRLLHLQAMRPLWIACTARSSQQANVRIEALRPIVSGRIAWPAGEVRAAAQPLSMTIRLVGIA